MKGYFMKHRIVILSVLCAVASLSALFFYKHNVVVSFFLATASFCCTLRVNMFLLEGKE